MCSLTVGRCVRRACGVTGRSKYKTVMSDLPDTVAGLGTVGTARLPHYDRAVPDTSLAQVLRSRGLRMTPQRQLVLDAVRELGHATPEQVHAVVQRTSDAVNITTVYRALELLEEIGLVTHTHLSHGAPTYHPAADRPHIHLVCRGCGATESADPALLQTVADTLAADRGFSLDIAHVSLFGTCGGCGGAR